MSPAIVVVAKDVRGVEKRVVIDDSGTSIDDVRRAVARAYGVENHRARCYLVDGDDRGGGVAEDNGFCCWSRCCSHQ